MAVENFNKKKANLLNHIDHALLQLNKINLKSYNTGMHKPREYEKFEISLNLKHLSCIVLRLACFDDLDNAYSKCERIKHLDVTTVYFGYNFKKLTSIIMKHKKYRDILYIIN